tara:strand:- start:2768 stop:4066 length:1299 start_codon:yes stop_codon:yes gene_type:complete
MKLPRTKLYISLFELVKAYFKILFGLDLKKGDQVKKFENLLENYWSRKKCFTLSTCRLALYYVLKSLKLNKHDEVLLSPIQIPDFINAISNLGLKPVFVEIDKETKCLNISDLKKKISNKTKVVLATYLTGIVPDISQIKSVCEENNIFLIEDISQSYGSESYNKKAGSFGIAAIGSLSPAKIISSVGGGFILIDDVEKINFIEKAIKSELSLPSKKTLLRICSFQIKVSIATSKYVFSFFTYYIFFILSKLFKNKFNELHHPTFKYSHKDKTIYDNPLIQRKLPNEIFFYFTDLQAKIAIKTFYQNINYGLKKRQLLAKVLYENLNEETKKFIPKTITKYNENCFWHFPIILENNSIDKFQDFLMNRGYDVVGYGLKLCSDESAFVSYKSNLVSADKIHKNTLFLPLFDNLNESQTVKIANDINIFFSNKR